VSFQFKSTFSMSAMCADGRARATRASRAALTGLERSVGAFVARYGAGGAAFAQVCAQYRVLTPARVDRALRALVAAGALRSDVATGAFVAVER
jgi:hypothetical protein